MTDLYEIVYEDPTPQDRWPSTSGNIILYDTDGDSWGIAKPFAEVDPLQWCEAHDSVWLSVLRRDTGSRCSFTRNHGNGGIACHREDPVGHWERSKP